MSSFQGEGSQSFSCDGRWLAASGRDRKHPLVWELKSRTLVDGFTPSDGTVRAVAFSPADPSILVCGSGISADHWVSGELFSVDVMEPSKRLLLARHHSILRSVAFNQAGNLVAGGGGDGEVIVAETIPGGKKFHIKAHADAVQGIAFDPSGKLIATGSKDGDVSLWKVDDYSRPLMFVAKSAGNVHDLDMSADVSSFVSACGDGRLYHWDRSSGTILGTIQSDAHRAYGVGWAIDSFDNGRPPPGGTDSERTHSGNARS